MIETNPMKLAQVPTPDDARPETTPAASEKGSAGLWWLSLLILALGLAVRILPSAGFTGTGFDEVLYRRYVILLDGGTQVVKVATQDMRSSVPYEIKLEGRGLELYPDLVDFFRLSQKSPDAMCELPPTRFFYIYAAWLWKRAEFGDAPPVPQQSPDFTSRDPALLSLHRVACLFSCLGLIVGGIATWRMLGLKALPGTLALLAFSPLMIHLGQHALIDGVFTFWAVLSLWLLWENLQRPNQRGLLLAFAAALAIMVTTKENSFFVYLALVGLVAANRWAKFGHVSPKLLIAMLLGPAFGVAVLVSLSGGVTPFVEIYQLLVGKAQNQTYAIKTGDGPWYRYLVDLLLISPLVLILAIGGVFTQVRGNRAFVFLVAFVGFSYLIMCNVRYGMNLRYASIWDLPLRALAAAQVGAIATRFGARQALVASVAIAALCAYDLRQYQIYFVQTGLYELVTGGLMHAVKMLK